MKFKKLSSLFKKEYIIVPKRLIILFGLVVCLSMCTMLTLALNDKIQRDISRIAGIVFFIIEIFFFFIFYKYIFGKKYAEYKGLSDREKSLYRELQHVKESRLNETKYHLKEIHALRKFAGFKDLLFPKISFIISSTIWISCFILTLLFFVSGELFDKYLPTSRLVVYFLLILLGTGFLLLGFFNLIFGKRSIEFCLNCDRIKVNNNWKHLTSFGNFSHSLCDTCAEALMKLRNEDKN